MSSEEPNYKNFTGNNAQWFTVFNPDTKQMHVAAGVGFQEHTGMLFFGDNFMNKERWDAYYTKVKERYPAPSYKVGE
ncbi:hypothetical protein M670_03176 [Schinkia azotoformans MEV2011]|uniref:Uncharacterized protein n=2 Tax=Schinkia azotoformans TaxID=1454 RepID=A0A072NWK4_SCHAZ|nr:hypothetical protein M670_03176 [Schinkia azotoformans MEV2011]